METLRVLTFSTLYPNRIQPQNGIFIEQRLRHLITTGKIQSRVVAPVPWFPLKHPRFGKYALFARVPRYEQRHGLRITYPRFAHIPKFGMSIAPFLMASAMKPVLRRIINNGFDFDILDAYYFYPVGVAAVLLGHHFKKPVVISALGTDVNLIPNYLLPRKFILWAARRASGITTVCEALKHKIVSLGVRKDLVRTIYHGVNLQLFRPINREAERQQLGLTKFTLLSVGNLIKLKGHDIVIRALADIPSACLLIAGEGPEEHALRHLVESLGLQKRVRFVGHVPHDDLKTFYGVADALVLASSSEGIPNVILEAMACGTPVIATNVGGVSEAVTTPEAGLLISERSSEALLTAVRTLMTTPPNRAATRAYAENFNWDKTSRQQIELFETIMKEQRSKQR